MNKIFKSLIVILSAFLIMPLLYADEIKEENDPIYTTYIVKEEYLAEGKAAMREYYDNYDEYSIVYKLCLKGSESCIYSDDTKGTLTTFEKGKTYVMSTVVSAKDGYEFSDETDFRMGMDDSIIDSTKISFNEDNTIATLTDIYEVSDIRTTIKEINITGATLNFKIGDEVKFTAKPSSDTYTIEYEEWSYDNDDDYASAYSKVPDYYSGSNINTFTKFEKNVYSYSIAVKAAEGYMFDKDTILNVNGKKAIIAGGEIMYQAYGISTLDLTDKPIKDKNENVIHTAVMTLLILNSTKEKDFLGMSEELLDAINSVTTDLSFDLSLSTITDSEEISNAKTKVDALIKNANIASYLDLSINVTVDGSLAGKITELFNPVDLIVEVPNNLPKVENGKLRVYSVVRIHDGQAEEIPTFDNGDGTVTITTDRFSTYVLTYKDIASPNTGDNVITYLLVSVMSLMALAISTYMLKKNN